MVMERTVLQLAKSPGGLNGERSGKHRLITASSIFYEKPAPGGRRNQIGDKHTRGTGGTQVMEALHHQRFVPAPRSTFHKQAHAVAQLKAIDPGPLARLPAGMKALDGISEKRLKMGLDVCTRLVHACIIEGGQGLVKAVCLVITHKSPQAP